MMFTENYRSMNEQITPSQELINKVANSTNNNLKKTKTAFRKLTMIAALVIVCVATAIPVFAANIPFITQLMYHVSPSVAQFFTPVQLSCEDNGVKMEIVSVYIHDGTAEIYITMQDLTGNRIDETTDLFDSYSINRPFSSIANCLRIGYDEDTKTATFLITITEYGDQKIIGDKITFSVREFISGKQIYDNIPIDIDLSAVDSNPKTAQTSRISGGGGFESLAPDAFSKMCRDNITVLEHLSPMEFPVEGINFTGIGYIDGMLHMQIEMKNVSQNDNHGYFFFKHKTTGNIVHCDYNVYFDEYDEYDEKIAYDEMFFSIPQSELNQYELYGYFVTSSSFTEGNWKVTFPLKNYN